MNPDPSDPFYHALFREEPARVNLRTYEALRAANPHLPRSEFVTGLSIDMTPGDYPVIRMSVRIRIPKFAPDETLAGGDE